MLTFWPWEVEWVMFTSGADPGPCSLLIHVDKAARRSPLRGNTTHKQHQMSVSCWWSSHAFLKKRSLLQVWLQSSPLYGKSQSWAISGSGSIFVPPEFCRMPFMHSMPGMWHWLCVLSRTINQRSSLSLKWNNTPILADSFVFLVHQNNVSPQDTCLSRAGMAVMTGDRQCHCTSTQKKRCRLVETAYLWSQSCSGGTRDKQCTMRFQRVDGSWSLELLTLFSCPHQAFKLYHNRGH